MFVILCKIKTKDNIKMKKKTNMVIYEQDTEINLTGVQYFANILLFT